MIINYTMYRNRYLVVALPTLLALAPETAAHAEGQRVALVVGISGYQAVTALPNAGRDAHSVGDALRANGFAVTELTNPADLDRAKLSLHLLAFRRAAEGAEAAVIYFAGHGVEWRGKNWLLPRDASADTPDALEVTALPSSALVTAVSAAGKVRLVVLDACRDNPFATRAGWSTGTRAAGVSRGLARERELPPNVVVLLATQPEERASDGQGSPNSPFAMAFSTALRTPGMQLYKLPTAVARTMREQAAIDQRPDVQGIFDEPEWRFSVVGAVGGAAPAVAATPATSATAAAFSAQTGQTSEPGYLGLKVQALSDDLADTLGLARNRGEFIQAVMSGRGAAVAGILPGDVVVRVDGKEVSPDQTVSAIIARTAPGRRIEIKLVRNGQNLSLWAVVGKRPSDEELNAATYVSDPSPIRQGGSSTSSAVPGANSQLIGDSLGLAVLPLTTAILHQLGVSEDTKGLVITAVAEATDAATRGLQRGDIVLSANYNPVTTTADLEAVVRAAKAENRTAILLRIKRGGQEPVYLPLHLR